jgi:hypothetical protein
MVESARLRLEAQKQLWVVSLVPRASHLVPRASHLLPRTSYLLPPTSYLRIYHLPRFEKVSLCVSLTFICE